MFQPALRAFESSEGLAYVGPAPSGRSRIPAFPATFEWPALGDIDLAVDLGNRIGSKTWWRGLATLAALSYGALALGLRPAPIPVAVQLAPLPVEAALLRADRIEPLALGGATGATTPATNRVVRLAEPPERPRIEVTARLHAVDSVGAALRRAGVGPEEAKSVADMIGGDAKSIKAGTAFELVLGRRDTKSVPRPLDSLAVRAAFDLKLEVARGEDGALKLKRIPIAVDNTPLRVSGRVGSSLYRAARAAGLPGGAVADAIKALGYRLDMSRDVRAGDRFDLIVKHRRAATGETETGELLYAAIDGRKDAAVMRWNWGGKTQFFLPDGSSAKKGLMRTPVDGAHLTSGFGFRIHPILGYSRLHKGVDFGAGTGAPVMSAAGGTVVFAGWHGGHGNYVMVDHGKGLRTAYAHLSRISVRTGQRVGQGDRVGLVGSTGMSTGPHLHYEVYQGGKAIDPRGAKFAAGTQLAGGELSRFRSEMNRLKGVRQAGPVQTAEAGKKDKKA